MADFAFTPNYDQQVDYGPNPTLVTRLTDGTAIVREKNPTPPEIWSEVYTLSGADFDTVMAFYQLKRLATPFTKVSFDVAGTPTQERTVRFAAKIQWKRTGLDWFDVTLTFERWY